MAENDILTKTTADSVLFGHFCVLFSSMTLYVPWRTEQNDPLSPPTRLVDVQFVSKTVPCCNYVCTGCASCQHIRDDRGCCLVLVGSAPSRKLEIKRETGAEAAAAGVSVLYTAVINGKDTFRMGAISSRHTVIRFATVPDRLKNTDPNTSTVRVLSINDHHRDSKYNRSPVLLLFSEMGKPWSIVRSAIVCAKEKNKRAGDRYHRKTARQHDTDYKPRVKSHILNEMREAHDACHAIMFRANTMAEYAAILMSVYAARDNMIQQSKDADTDDGGRQEAGALEFVSASEKRACHINHKL